MWWSAMTAAVWLEAAACRHPRESGDNGAGEPKPRDAAGVPDPEVEPRAKGRRFSAAYKARIVEEGEKTATAGSAGIASSRW